MSAVVTWNDLETYFKGSWTTKKNLPGGGLTPGELLPEAGLGGLKSPEVFTKTKGPFSVEIESGEVQFRYKVEALEDPSDRDEGVTSEPLKAIAKFLGRDIPGGEFFERMSASPALIAGVLRVVAERADRSGQSRRSGRTLTKALRRASAAVQSSGPLDSMRPQLYRYAVSESEEAFEELRKKAESKGWNVKPGTRKSGAPELVIEVGDDYEAKMVVDSIEYHYTFQFADRPDLTESGSTEDPIRAFQRYYRSPEVDEAVGEFRSRGKVEEGLAKTVPAGPAFDGRTAPP